MFKRSKGFTLIELLIVVAIIGILAALLIPNMMNAMQRAKQKGTMADISTISTILMDFTTDRGIAPALSGPYTTAALITLELVPNYAKVIPTTDQWGNDYVIQSGSSWTAAWLGMTPPGSDDDFAVGSPGRDDAFTFAWDGTPNLYVNDFDLDLVSWNGQFVCRPATTSSGT